MRTSRRTDGHDEAKSLFAIFRTRLKIVLEPTKCTFIYQWLLHVSATISGHSQGAVIKVLNKA